MTKNETILIDWDGVMFSENVFAYFEHGLCGVISDKIEDVLLPEDYVYNLLEEGVYEIFGFDQEAEEYLYTGRLYTAKGKPLDGENEL
jgi:hypothetical protein